MYYIPVLTCYSNKTSIYNIQQFIQSISSDRLLQVTYWESLYIFKIIHCSPLLQRDVFLIKQLTIDYYILAWLGAIMFAQKYHFLWYETCKVKENTKYTLASGMS